MIAITFLIIVVLVALVWARHSPLRRKPERDQTSVTPDAMQPTEGYMRALMGVSSRGGGNIDAAAHQRVGMERQGRRRK